MTIAGIIIAMIVAEYTMGRTPLPWPIRVWGGTRDSSRMVIDWYSPSHLIHGLLFYWLTGELVYAVAIEAAWEVAENSTWIIERYRHTSAPTYRGDTILNSVSDVACMACGFWLAQATSLDTSIFVAVACEMVTMAVIHDGLLLNCIMLAHPFEAIKEWQEEVQ